MNGWDLYVTRRVCYGVMKPTNIDRLCDPIDNHDRGIWRLKCKSHLLCMFESRDLCFSHRAVVKQMNIDRLRGLIDNRKCRSNAPLSDLSVNPVLSMALTTSCLGCAAYSTLPDIMESIFNQVDLIYTTT